MKKKMTGILLALCLIVGMLPVSSFAEERSADTWDGTADTSWYTAGATEYHLTTAEQLAGVAKLTNDQTTNFAGVTIFLDVDVDLSGYEWSAIGQGDSGGKSFEGTFDGQDHIIYNLTSKGTEDGDGLFYRVRNGTVQNLGLVNVNITTNANFDHHGALVSVLQNARIRNCFVTGTLYPNAGLWGVGGIVGSVIADTGSQDVSVIENCHSYVDITSNLSRGSNGIGGIVGAAECRGNKVEIRNSSFHGTINGTGDDCLYGGIIGLIYNASFNTDEAVATIDNCFSNGTLSVSGTGSEAAEIGFVQGYVRNCYWKADGELPGVKVIAVDPSGSVVDGNPVWLENSCKAIADFTSQDFLNLLNENAGETKLVMGTEGPTSSNDVIHMLADYSAVNAAIKKAESLNRDYYKDFSDVEAAINAVVRGKTAIEQDTVDGYAVAIENAIKALKYKDADYSKVDEAIAKANALNKDDYKDFSAVEAAVNAVVRGKNITEQAAVDAMEKAIINAISALEKKSSTDSGTAAKPSELNTDTTSSQTGDNSNIWLWIALILVSGGTVATLTVAGKKKKNADR